MFDFDIISFFSQFAYQPYAVYSFIILFMTASSFGLPIPEELVVISAGLVAYMAHHPEIYPPPTPDAHGVNIVTLSAVCFLAVLGSDILIYMIGKIFGKRLIRTKFFNKHVGQERFNRINKFFQKYSYWACGLFRFTPGVRFPGHMSCGLMGIPLWKFIMVDGIAALISVPTQVVLVATYGNVILEQIKRFKLFLAAVIGILILFWLSKKLFFFIKNRRPV